MPVDLGTLTRVDPGQFGAVGGRDRRADRAVALSYTDVMTQTACWEERSQVCDEIRLALAEVRRRTPSAEPAWGPRGTTPRLTVRGTAAGAPPPPPPPLTHSPTHPLTHSPTHPLTHSPTHPLTHSPTHPLTHSPTRPLAHSPTRPLTHSSTHPLRSGQVVPATTVRQPAKCVRRQDVWPNTRTRNTESRCRFRRNRDAQKGLQPVDEDYLTQRGLQLVGAQTPRRGSSR